MSASFSPSGGAPYMPVDAVIGGVLIGSGTGLYMLLAHRIASVDDATNADEYIGTWRRAIAVVAAVAARQPPSERWW